MKASKSKAVKTVVVVLCAALVVSACGLSRNVPRSWRPVTLEERALKWAVKLCHQFGYTEDNEDRRICIARRYDQYIMENG
jgi:hypothetical protein